jgi:hypothetical protein
MTLASTLLKNLAELPETPGRSTFHVASGDWDVRLVVDRKESLGCLLWELAVSRMEGKDGEPSAWAARVASRATGLLEPLAVIEIDKERRQALLRSAAPANKPEGPQFYEMLLDSAQSGQLRRWQGSTTQASKRSQIPFGVTFEALTKLILDMTAEA